MLALPLIARGGHAFLRIVQDPNRLEEVFRLIETIHENPRFRERLVEGHRKGPNGAQALREQPRVGRIDLEALSQLPPGTLGHEYAGFMRRNGLDPSSLPQYPVHDEASFVEAHLRETHDLWHVVTGFGSDVAGELGLQAFYLAQLPNPVAMSILGAGMLNALIYRISDTSARMRQISRGWRMGRQARPFFGMDWKQLWTTPLSEVRARMGIERMAEDEVSPELRSRDVRGEPMARA